MNSGMAMAMALANMGFDGWYEEIQPRDEAHPRPLGHTEKAPPLRQNWPPGQSALLLQLAPHSMAASQIEMPETTVASQ